MKRVGACCARQACALVYRAIAYLRNGDSKRADEDVLRARALKDVPAECFALIEGARDGFLGCPSANYAACRR